MRITTMGGSEDSLLDAMLGKANIDLHGIGERMSGHKASTKAVRLYCTT